MIYVYLWKIGDLRQHYLIEFKLTRPGLCEMNNIRYYFIIKLIGNKFEKGVLSLVNLVQLLEVLGGNKFIFSTLLKFHVRRNELI